MLTDDEIGRLLAGESPIRVLREHRGLSLRQLAHQAGLRPDQLDRYERGRVEPRADRLARIAEVLEVDVIALRPCADHFADCARQLRDLGEDAQ